MRATGTPEQSARKLEIPERKLHRILSLLMKALHAPLVYSTSRQNYMYETPVWFYFGFYSQKLSGRESREIEGGLGFPLGVGELPSPYRQLWDAFRRTAYCYRA